MNLGSNFKDYAEPSARLHAWQDALADIPQAILIDDETQTCRLIHVPKTIKQLETVLTESFNISAKQSLLAPIDVASLSAVRNEKSYLNDLAIQDQAREAEIVRACNSDADFLSADTLICATHRNNVFAHSAGFGMATIIPAAITLPMDAIDHAPRLLGLSSLSGRDDLITNDTMGWVDDKYRSGVSAIGLDNPILIDGTDQALTIAGMLAPGLVAVGASLPSITAKMGNMGSFARVGMGIEARAGVMVGGIEALDALDHLGFRHQPKVEQVFSF